MKTELKSDSYITIGQIKKPFGIKGCVSLRSFSDPSDNILNYAEHLFLKVSAPQEKLKLQNLKKQHNHYIATIEKILTPEDAILFSNNLIFMPKNKLNELKENEYYWHDLEGLTVKQYNSNKCFGKIKKIINTGANDILCIIANSNKEIYIPYIDQVIKSVSIDDALILVDWNEK